MNGLATAGVVGAAIGLGKGIIDQSNASRYDPMAGTDIQDYAMNGLINSGKLGLMGMGAYAGVNALRGKGFKIKGHTIDEIAEAVAKTPYIQSLTGKNGIMDDINTNMAKMVKDNKYITGIDKNDVRIQLEDAIDKIAGASDISPEILEQSRSIAKKSSLKNASESLDELETLLGSDPMLLRARQTIDGISYTKDNIKQKMGLDYYANIPGAYFMSPDKKVRNTRIGTAVGVTAATAIGGRYLTGGTLTTDSYGRKDIAGIPFI